MRARMTSREANVVPDDGGTMEGDRESVQQRVRVERTAYRLRAALCLLLLATTLTLAPPARWPAVLVALSGLALSLTVVVLLRGRPGSDLALRLAAYSLWLDVALALASELAMGPYGVATSGTLLALMAFRLATRYGRAGAVVGMLAFAAVLALRVALDPASVSGGDVPRAGLTAWLLTTGTVLVLALLLSAETSARAASEGDPGTHPPLRPQPHPQPTVPVPFPVPVPVAAAAADGPSADERLRAVLDTQGVRLTRREQEVFLLLGGGMTSGDIGRELGISASTVRNHLHNMRDKLELDDPSDLLVLARKARGDGHGGGGGGAGAGAG